MVALRLRPDKGSTVTKLHCQASFPLFSLTHPNKYRPYRESRVQGKHDLPTPRDRDLPRRILKIKTAAAL